MHRARRPDRRREDGLSLALAQRLDAEIVSDSRQVFRFLDIGTAKPTVAERAVVPHHLFDVVDPDEPFDCARYRDLARAVIADIRARGRRVVLVGGSGLYLKVLRYGLAPAPPRDARLRAQLAALEDAEPGALHARLTAVDAVAGARLHPHDRVRLIRALEVRELTGRPLSAWQAEHGFRSAELDCRMIGLEMPRRATRGSTRCRTMLDHGLLDEVRGLWARGYVPRLAPLQSTGYREAGAHLRGECDLDAALAAMQRTTRRFAKRQRTWFRADPLVEWIDAESVSLDDVVRRAAAAPSASAG